MTMQSLRFIAFIWILTLTACSTVDTSQKNLPKSDTSQVLELAVKAAFHGFLPDASSVKDKFYFKDSILFTSKTFPLDSLPTKVDSLQFKILSENIICGLILSDSLLENHPNYLSVQAFEKSDTGYYVQLASLSCFPYGGGGSLGLYIAKQSDTFYIKTKMATSIN
jgi:hypothetical protein